MNRRNSTCRRPLAGLFFVATVVLSYASCRADDMAFLHPNEKIMWIGDSITAQNLYERYVMGVLKAIYPDAGFTDVNCGIGGATAPSRFSDIPQRIERDHPTLITVMFGVNDTGWGANNAEQKIETYAKGLQLYVDAAKKHSIPLVFLRETHFSHNATPQSLERDLDGLLLKLFTAEDKVAADNQLHVIDAYGNYTSELRKAWKIDPRYEFTPNFVHPTMLGHSAVAAEILRSFGAGLPLAAAGQERGPLKLGSQHIELEAEPQTAVVAPDGVVHLKVGLKGDATLPENATLLVVTAGRKFSAPVSGSLESRRSIDVELPASMFGSTRADVQPIYLALVGKGIFAASETPLQVSRLVPTNEKAFTIPAAGWVQWEGVKPATSTVTDLKVTVNPHGLAASFQWKDSTPVAARREPYKARLGEPVTTPLDSTSPFGQPCDAVELLLDLRDARSAGRYTSDMDSLPDGTTRVGLYRIEEAGKLVPRLQVTPASMSDSFKLVDAGDDQFTIEYAGAFPNTGIGFNMFVTDATEYAPNKTSGAWLTSVPLVGVDWADFFRLTPGATGTFVRIGY